MLGWLGQAAFHAGRLALTASQARTQLAKLQDGSGLELQAVTNWLPGLHRAAGDLASLQKLSTPVRPLLAIFGQPGRQVYQLLDYTAQLAGAGDQLAAALAPALDPAGSTPLLAGALGTIQGNQAQITAGRQELERAWQTRQQMDIGTLPAPIQGLMARLDERLPDLMRALGLLELAPQIAGLDGPQTYLLVIQNRDELRATGGFISGLGTVTLEDGRVVSLEIQDSYAVDDFSQSYPPPPDPLARFMLAGYWLARDANWSPDFPSAARKVAELYAISRHTQADGVIALDLGAIQALLAVTGPVQAPGFSEAVTSVNVETLVRTSWSAEPGEALDEAWWLGRKDFMGQLGRAMLGKALEDPEPAQLMRLAEVFVQLIEQGHLLVYFSQPQAQAALTKAGWDGSLPDQAGGDYLYLVDSNLGFNKMDAVMRRELRYTVDLSDPKHPAGRVEVLYTNPVAQTAACIHTADYGSGQYEDMTARCYWDYYRLYTPVGTMLMKGQCTPPAPGSLLGGESTEVLAGLTQTLTPEAGLQPFGGMLVVPAASQGQVRLDLAMPAATLLSEAGDQLTYTLTVRKQAGLDSLPMRIQVLLPEGARVEAPAGWQPAEDGSLAWSGEVRQEQVFVIQFRLPRNE